MRLREWIETFRFLHEKARRGRLRGKELAKYREARDDLAALLLAAQRLSFRPGETAREALRVARALPLDVRLSPRPLRAVTLDISTGGFSSRTSRICSRVKPKSRRAKMRWSRLSWRAA